MHVASLTLLISACTKYLYIYIYKSPPLGQPWHRRLSTVQLRLAETRPLRELSAGFDGQIRWNGDRQLGLSKKKSWDIPCHFDQENAELQEFADALWTHPAGAQWTILQMVGEWSGPPLPKRGNTRIARMSPASTLAHCLAVIHQGLWTSSQSVGQPWWVGLKDTTLPLHSELVKWFMPRCPTPGQRCAEGFPSVGRASEVVNS